MGEGEGEGEKVREGGGRTYLAAEVRVAREVNVDVSIKVRDASREVIVCKAPTNNIRNVREMEGER